MASVTGRRSTTSLSGWQSGYVPDAARAWDGGGVGLSGDQRVSALQPSAPLPRVPTPFSFSYHSIHQGPQEQRDRDEPVHREERSVHLRQVSGFDELVLPRKHGGADADAEVEWPVESRPEAKGDQREHRHTVQGFRQEDR